MRHRRFSLFAFHFSILIGMSVLMSSCRDDADHLLSYGQSDDLVFEEAGNSFTEKFNIFWEGMNCNYALWDYEASFGLDWDRVYDEFMPRFHALDERKDSVSDEEFKALLTELVAPLHDGHLAIIQETSRWYHPAGYATRKNEPTISRVVGLPPSCLVI